VERTPRLLRQRRGKGRMLYGIFGDGGSLLGLCAGIGAHLGVDPVIVRLVWLVLTFLPVGGLVMIPLYVIFALCVPFEPDA
jgi:phage shock protein PspC (stress-responsive transcriptional regulator)